MTDWGYARSETPRTERKTGKMACCIMDAYEATSSKGNPMIVVEVRPSGSRFNVRYYMVKNQWFNQNASQFFDAFPAIKDGNFNLIEWVGASGVAYFDLDDRGYLKVKYFCRPEESEDVPAFVGEKPQRVEVQSLEEADEQEDGLPF